MAEMERLIELGYTVEYETYNDGSAMHYNITLYATKEQLTDFAQAEPFFTIQVSLNSSKTVVSHRVMRLLVSKSSAYLSCSEKYAVHTS